MYNPKIWYDGDIVTSGGLNNIEQGIAQNAHDIEDLQGALGGELESYVNDWLDSHPEATTTVQDGAISETKLSELLKFKAINNYVTPQMFGAKADGVTDDTQSIQSAIDSGKNVFFPKGTYICGVINITGNNIIIDGSYSTLLHGSNSGFIFSKTAHDVTIRNIYSVCDYVKDSQKDTNVHIGISSDNDSPNNEYYAYNITIQNCKFAGGVMGISASSAKNIDVYNCQFNDFVYKPEDSAGGYGILLQSCINVKIEFCDFNLGSYGRHDIYVSVDRRKTTNKQCKNVIINSCKFDHSDLVLDNSGYYYSPNTTPINVRMSALVSISNCYFYSVVGMAAFYSEDGIVTSSNVSDCIIDTPVLNNGSAEMKYIINLPPTNYYVTLVVDNVGVINEPSSYTSFASLANCNAKIINSNIGATRILCGDGVTVQLNNITTNITYYFIRFNGSDETKGYSRNITFLTALVGEKYYFASGSSVPSDFFGEPTENITLNIEQNRITDLVNNSYRHGKIAVLSGYFKAASGISATTIFARLATYKAVARTEGMIWTGNTMYPMYIENGNLVVANTAISASTAYVFFKCTCILQ